MPSSQQPSVAAKPRGIYLRKKMAEIINPSLKTGSKICASVTKNRSNLTTPNSEPNNSSGGNAIGVTNNSNSSGNADVERTSANVNVLGGGFATPNSNQNASQTSTANISVQENNDNSNNNITNDGNNNHVASFPSIFTTNEPQTSANQGSCFAAASRLAANDNTSCTAGGSASATTTFTTTSSSHQRLHRQITRTSEMKTSCVKSDLSELQSSFAEMKNLNFSNAKFCNASSFENLLDGSKEPGAVPAVDGGPGTGEPVITYPDSPTPSNSGILCFPAGSRKNSLATTEEVVHCSSPSASVNNELKFEQKHSISAASRTKMITEQFKTQESVIGNTTEKSVDARHEQRLLTENLTHQQSQNVSCSSSSSHVRMQAEAFSSEKVQKASAAHQQRQLSSSSSSSGLYNQEKVIAQLAQHSNFSSSMGYTTMSHRKQSNAEFVKSEVDATMNVARQLSVSEHMNETFEDLDRLRSDTTEQKDVDQALSKYSERLRQVVDTLKQSNSKMPNAFKVLNKLSEMMSKAWLVPKHGHTLGTRLCDELRTSGGLDLLISNCNSIDDDLKFSSAMLLEQCLTTDNRAFVVNNGLEKVVCMTRDFHLGAKSPEHSRISTGILAHLFKHSEGACREVIKLKGLETVVQECRKNDIEILRHCASALANLALYGGVENHEAMIKSNVPMWLFPLALHSDDSVKYYACLAIAVLVANKEMEAAVLQSGTLDLVEPFVTGHDPFEFARSNLAHAHGQSQNWLQRLVPVLSSEREEARNLAAFHFCMEAGIKKTQGNKHVFNEIGAIESLKKVASCPNKIASRFAANALRLIGEEVPHQLIQQVPLWSVTDVKQWVKQIGFEEYCENFEQSRVDGDLLLQLTDENLKEDLGMKNGIWRIRFERDLQNLKKMADYSSRDTDNLNSFLQSIGPEFTVYTYSILNAGVNREYLKSLSQDQLLRECGITNSIHRLRILESIKAERTLADTFHQDLEKPLDVFISYRRSNGSQLASLLKVHLQVRNFSVFLDVERLEAGKFDNNLLQSIKQASNFILVLTPNALDRCMEDPEKDWVHREIVTALQSQCNIIPITDNFQWPEPDSLPEDMQAICRFNGIRWIHDYQDACVEKIERFIKGEVSSRNPNVDLALTTPHGGRSLKNEMKSPPSFQRTQSSNSKLEADTFKD